MNSTTMHVTITEINPNLSPLKGIWQPRPTWFKQGSASETPVWSVPVSVLIEVNYVFLCVYDVEADHRLHRRSHKSLFA